MSGKYISRDRIMSYLNDIWLSVTPNDFMPDEDIEFAKVRCEGIKDAMDAIESIPAADVVERPRWISVEERLPKDEKDVLAYYGFKHDGILSDQRFIGTLCYFRFDPNPHWQHEGQGKLTVTHWMPLPEPPKEET